MTNQEKKRDNLVCVYSFASGRSFDDCVFLGQRYRERTGDSPDVSDYWVLAIRSTGADDTEITRVLKWKRWLTGIWRSPSGVVWIADATGKAVHRFPDVYDLSGRPPTESVLGAVFEGVWGLDDQNVFAWGMKKSARGQRGTAIFRFDGTSWVELPAPGFDVIDMRGIAPDLILAVGVGGGVARWDGCSWTRFQTPTTELLCCVHAVGPDEFYACGHGGSILAGSLREWSKIGEMPQGLPAFAVAKFRDQLFVAGGPLGLFRHCGSARPLELIKPNIKATWFDARGDLVITCDTEIDGTADGEAFFGTAEDFLCQTTADLEILD